MRHNGASQAFLTYRIICEGDVPPKFEAEIDGLIEMIETTWKQVGRVLTKLFDDRRKLESNAMLIMFEISDDLESVGRVTLQLSINRDVAEHLLKSVLEHYFEQAIKEKLVTMLAGPIDIEEEGEDLYLNSEPLSEDPATNENVWYAESLTSS
ncbi:MAG TPA: hypothetical protein VFT49_00565 [Candidatus Saccharimonadales bacterium]|nr:hypothetical protein [Candidatus Saccharimonadales bacterium]